MFSIQLSNTPWARFVNDRCSSFSHFLDGVDMKVTPLPPLPPLSLGQDALMGSISRPNSPPSSAPSGERSGFWVDEISFRRGYRSCRIGVVRRRRSSTFDVPHLWKLCGITSVILELHFWDLVHCLLISFEKNRITPTPKKNQKKTKKDMDFHNGISCQRFELEGWGLVQCLLISFCFGSEILKKIGPPQPPKKSQKKTKKDMDFHNGISCQCFELEG